MSKVSPLIHNAAGVASCMLVKGAFCAVTQTANERLVRSFKQKRDGLCTLVLGSAAGLQASTRGDIETVLRDRLSANLTFRTARGSRAALEDALGTAMYDERAPPDAATELSVHVARELDIRCSPSRVLKDCSLIEKIELVSDPKEGADGAVTIEYRVVMKSAGCEACTDAACDKCEALLASVGAPSGLPRVGLCVATAGPLVMAREQEAPTEQTVTPWEVEASQAIDYAKLIEQFGCEPLGAAHVDAIAKLSGAPAHHLLRRGVLISHRDLEAFLRAKESGEEVYVYTGRGPSSEALHMGHLVPFMITAYLQKVLGCIVVIQLTDDEKYLFKGSREAGPESFRALGYSNTRDIIACGFDPARTFIFSDIDYIKEMYPTVLRIQKHVTYNQSRGIFGFTESDNIGKAAFPAVQAAPSFGHCFPGFFKNPKDTHCLIPQAIDQDPYFRMTRDVAPRLGLRKPALIHAKFLPALQGFDSKMSGSAENTCIYVDDTPEQIATKINKKAFTGGQATAEEQRRLGANLAVDVPFHYLTFFLEDDARLAEIGRAYSAGEMSSGEIKKELIACLTHITQEHQKRKALVTDEIVKQFMDPKKLQKYAVQPM